MSELSFGEVGEILHLLQAIDGSEIELEWGDLKIQVRRCTSTAVSGGGLATAADKSTNVLAGVEPQPPGALAPAEHSTSAEEAGAAQPIPEDSGGTPEHWVPISAPMAGTFYRAPTPADPPFAEVGDAVSVGDTVALIEVMKLFTELMAEVSGRVARVDVPDTTLVEFGQTLVWIDPA